MSLLHCIRLPASFLLGALGAAAPGCGDSTGTPGIAGGLPAGTVPVALQRVASGLDVPLFVTAPAGDPRVFVVEKAGRIRVLQGAALLQTPFLDISSLVSTGSEQGLLGLAFSPSYAATGLFLVDYTDLSGNTQVVSYRVSAADPNVADPTTARVVLSVAQPFANHNGGEVTFGPDGDLYVGLGDGGSEGDPQGHGQDRADLLGSLLRIALTPDGAGYSVPADNPFAGATSARGELWNIGLRNPWRFSFDRATGELYIADVGQNAYEEVNVLPAGDRGGENFGWNIMEGLHCYASSNCDRTGLTLPVLEYGHDAGCSITGGYVYRGAAIPALQGTYFYGDYCSGFVKSFRWQGAVTEQRNWPTLAPGGGITSFGEDAAGELYLTTASGDVYRMVSAAGERR
jgi:glucose/arabinose dehydrogenase